MLQIVMDCYSSIYSISCLRVYYVCALSSQLMRCELQLIVISEHLFVLGFPSLGYDN